MVSSPSFDRSGLNKRAWTQEEDKKLSDYVTRYGHWNWSLLPKFAGLARSGKSCRFRWMNYLRPNIKRGNYTKEEEETIIKLHHLLGNRWSAIASQMPGRTDNEIKNYWHTYLKKRFIQSTVTKPQMSKSKDHLKDKQIKLKKRFQHALVIEAQTTMAKDHSPVVEPIVNNLIGPYQNHHHTTQLHDSFPFPQHSPTSGSSSISSEYTTVANTENMNHEDEFAFLNVDKYPMSGNFLLNSHMPNISYVPSELDYFSQVKSVTKDHSLVELTADDTIGPFQSHHTTQLANSCPFLHRSSLSESSSTSATHTIVANNENMDLEDDFAFPDADTNHMGGNFLLEPCMLEISHVPIALDNFIPVNSVTEAQVSHSSVEEPTTNNNIIGPFHCHLTTQLSDSCLFSQHSSSSTSTKYATIANSENMDLQGEFTFLDAYTYPPCENFLLEPYMPDNSHLPNEPEYFNSVNIVTEEAQVSKSKDHSANMESTPKNIIIGPFQSHHTIQLADSWAFSEHSSLSKSSSTDENFTTVTNIENIVLVDDEFVFRVREFRHISYE